MLGRGLFLGMASGAVLKAISLKKLTGTVHREAVLRQVERLMSLQETLPSRFRSVWVCPSDPPFGAAYGWRVFASRSTDRALR